jgi:5-methyltetrahydrofolate--homocysteine methyltransferase
LQVEEKIGISLTETFAMNPPSSCCGLYIANPNAKYFSIQAICKDQQVDYSRRKGCDRRTTQKWINQISVSQN